MVIVIFTLALCSLVIGLLFYLYFRPEGSAVLLQMLPVVHNIEGAIYYREQVNWLPSFLHVLSFSLLTWLLLARCHAVLCAVTWCTINLFFEFAQIEAFSEIYFPGTFDPADIIACLAGALVAVLMMKTTKLRWTQHEKMST